MPSFKKIWILSALLLAALALAGCGLSLAEDVTPPPNYISPTPPPEKPVNLETVFPIVPPDPAAGQAIFAEKCLPCHGAQGMGDGPQAANLPNPPAAIGSPEVARKSRPVDWYQIVSNGNLERFMPGFSGSLNDRQRWDVVAYVYTLSSPQSELAQGQEIYQSTCANCHGQTGKGDGPQAASLSTQPASWTDQSRLAQRSADDLVAQMREIPFHTFSEKLDDAQAYAAAAYIRTLSFAGAGQPAQAAANAGGEAAPTAQTGTGSEGTPPVIGTPEVGSTPGAEGTPAAEVPSKITVSGKVSNGTPGGKVPEGVKVTLSAYVNMQPSFELATDTTADGTYTFENVEYKSDYVYFVTAETGGLNFNSDILHGTDVQGGKAELPVQIYDTTTDNSVLRTDRLHIFFDFSQPGKVQVVNLYIISNPSGKAVVPTEQGKPVLTFDLPSGAENLQFQDSQIGQRYVTTENGFGDTAAIAPGEGQNQILFAYDLPYTSSLDFQTKVPMPVDAAVVMVPASGVSLKSDRLIDAGKQDVQGMSFQMYQAASSLKAGDTIDLSLSGKPGSGAAAGGAAGADNNTLLLIGVGVFGLALIGAGLYLFNQRKQSALAAESAYGGAEEVLEEEPDGETSDALLDKIVALDDQHASGGLPEAAYQQRRAELKARLSEILRREKGE